MLFNKEPILSKELKIRRNYFYAEKNKITWLNLRAFSASGITADSIDLCHSL